MMMALSGQYLLLAIALIESERQRIDAPDLRTSYFSGRRSYYELYIDVLLRLDQARPGHGYAAQGLITAERARARELQEQLTERAIGAQADPVVLAHVVHDGGIA